MKIHHSSRAAVSCGLLVSIAALAVGAADATAGHPAKGKTYSGSIERASNVTYPIDFKVSQSGKKVDDFSLSSGYPVYCQGGGFGEAQEATAKISAKGTFTAKLPIYFAPSHEHQGYVKITGKFGDKGHESGKVITEFTKSKTCNGSSKYTATAG
jgi:hypothetical protein